MRDYKKERERNKDRKLMILGSAVSCFEPDYKMDADIWAVGSAFGAAYNDIKRVDLGFEIHDMGLIAGIKEKCGYDFNKHNCPIMVQDENHPATKQLMKLPVTFPLDDVLEYVKGMGAAVQLSCSFDYMMIYAAMLGYKDIGLFKILLTNEGEYFLERPGVEYWIRWLGMHEGIKFYFPEDAEMLSDRVMYAYEERPNLWKLQSRKKFLWQNHFNHYIKIENYIQNGARAAAMVEMYNIMKKLKLITKQETKEINQNKKEVDGLLAKCQEQSKSCQDQFHINRDQFLQFVGAIQTLDYAMER